MSALFSIQGVLLGLFAYLAGGIPFGVILSRKFWGKDPRKGGSGGIGFTNVMRVVGKKAAFLTLALDTLKGTLSVALARALLPDPAVLSVIALLAVAGHSFPVYLAFKGGKGIATGFGVLLGLSPPVAVVTFLLWNGAYFAWKYSSLAGLISFAMTPAAFLLTGHREFLPFSLILTLLIFYQHRANIKRLIEGKENRMSSKPP
jgi:glycerol-3-phosphate acyltransferase PlsY